MAVSASDPIFPEEINWTSHNSSGDRGCMPAGNGDVAANVWTEADAGIMMYLIKADVFGENDSAWDCPVPKLGKLALSFSGGFSSGAPVSQRLNMDSGTVEITTGSAGNQVRVKIWSDANRPEIHITMEADKNTSAQCAMNTWRTETQTPDGSNSLVSWYKFGQPFRWDSYLPNDMVGRIYGCKITAPDGWSLSGTTLSGSVGQEPVTIDITMLNDYADNGTEFISAIKALHEECAEVPLDEAYADHCKWWRKFWSRSWVSASGFNEAAAISEFHACQRYVNACAGRSRVPIHFNGSVFNVTENGSPDYKKWGGAYWMCNTRPIYWPMLETGDWDQMQPFFDLYSRPEVQEANVKQAYEEFKIPGGYIHEIVNRTGCAYQDSWGFPDYHTRYFSSGLEFLSIAFDYWSMSGDTALLRKNIIPTAYNLILFYKSFGTMGGDGKLHWIAINGLETYWRADDPASDLGGLRWITKKALELDESLLPDSARELFEEVQSLIPNFTTNVNGTRVQILPTANGDGPVNMENPEMYCIFPYRLFSVGTPGLEDTGRVAWDYRIYGGMACWGWYMHGIHAAYLGWPDLASSDILCRVSPSSWRFPGYKDNGDWPPAQDHAGWGLKDINASLIQADDGKIFLFPAWPSSWDVEFKLYTLEQTSIEVKYHGGEITYISVFPDERYDDIEVMNGASLPSNEVIHDNGNITILSDASISLNELSLATEIIVAPSTNSEWSIKLVDMRGRQIMESLPKRGNAVIKAKQLSPGMYFCILHSGTAFKAKQFLISGK